LTKKLTRWFLPSLMAKAQRILVIGLLAILLLAFPLSVNALPSSQTWESYTSGDDADYEAYGAIWYAQTFTVTDESHSVKQVRIKAYREGLPSTVTISIRAVGGSNLPTGDDITSGTFDGDGMTTDTAGAWYGVTVTEDSLDYGTQYAVVIRAEAGDATNSLHIKYDGTAGTYAGGSECTSSNSGISWTVDTDDDVLFEVQGCPLIEITQVDVFSGYMEENDLLFAVQYFNTYTPYYPNADSKYYFTMQLRSADGTTVIGQTVCPDWGYKPAGIYLSADMASGLDDGAAYRIYIYGDLAETPLDYYTLTSADWRGDDITLLDGWILNTARDMSSYYGVDMTTYTPTGEKLNEQGSVIFALGILGLQYVRPSMFDSVVYTPDYTPEEWSNVYEESAVWSDVVGTNATEALTQAGTMLGANPRDVGGVLVVAAYLIVCLVIIGMGGDAIGAAILSSVFILGGSWLHLLDIALIAVIAGIAVLLLVYRFFWKTA